MTTPIILGALAYIIPTFVLAYFWHLQWFKSRYDTWTYTDGNPSIPLGFLSIVVQGIVLSAFYAWAPIDHASFVSAAAFIGIVAVLHWSVHVLAAMAKEGRMRNWQYFGLETLYLVLQFGLFAILISGIAY